MTRKFRRFPGAGQGSNSGLLHVVGVHLVPDSERGADEECHGDDGKAPMHENEGTRAGARHRVCPSQLT